jgi:hypothetical protein
MAPRLCTGAASRRLRARRRSVSRRSRLASRPSAGCSGSRGGAGRHGSRAGRSRCARAACRASRRRSGGSGRAVGRRLWSSVGWQPQRCFGWHWSRFCSPHSLVLERVLERVLATGASAGGGHQAAVSTAPSASDTSARHRNGKTPHQLPTSKLKMATSMSPIDRA